MNICLKSSQCLLFALLLIYFVILLKFLYGVQTHDIDQNLLKFQPTPTPLLHLQDAKTLSYYQNYRISHSDLFRIISQYQINNEFTCSGPVDVVICAHSNPVHKTLRNAVRQTWGSPTYWPGYRVKTLFFVGLVSSNSSLQAAIERENDFFNDIIQGVFEDSYRNLTFKALTLLQWVKTFCAQATYLLKVDDDMAVNIFSLSSLLLRNTKTRLRERELACATFENITVKRKGKWSATFEECPLTVYPRYCSGSLVLMRTSVASLLLDAVRLEKFFWVDDIYVTGMLAKVANITHRSLNHGAIFNENYIVVRLSSENWRNYYFGTTKNADIIITSWNQMVEQLDFSELKALKMNSAR